MINTLCILVCQFVKGLVMIISLYIGLFSRLYKKEFSENKAFFPLLCLLAGKALMQTKFLYSALQMALTSGGKFVLQLKFSYFQCGGLDFGFLALRFLDQKCRKYHVLNDFIEILLLSIYNNFLMQEGVLN